MTTCPQSSRFSNHPKIESPLLLCHSLTGTTIPFTKIPYMRIHFIERMSSQTNCPFGVQGRETGTTKKVYLKWDRFKMCWIHAQGIHTTPGPHMIQGKAFGDWANQKLIGESVCQEKLIANPKFTVEFTATILPGAGQPQPTSIWIGMRSNLLPESLIYWLPIFVFTLQVAEVKLFTFCE